MREYLTALDAITNELLDHPTSPRPTRLDRRLNRAVERAGLQIVLYVAFRLLSRIVYGQRQYELSDRMFAAAAHLRLIAPPAVEQLMREVEALAEKYRPGDEEWMNAWRAIRRRVRSRFRDELRAYA